MCFKQMYFAVSALILSNDVVMASVSASDGGAEESFVASSSLSHQAEYVQMTYGQLLQRGIAIACRDEKSLLSREADLVDKVQRFITCFGVAHGGDDVVIDPDERNKILGVIQAAGLSLPFAGVQLTTIGRKLGGCAAVGHTIDLAVGMLQQHSAVAKANYYKNSKLLLEERKPDWDQNPL